jgi:TatD DNase family protein
MYLNFHTHFESEDDDVIDFYNIDLKKGPSDFNKGKYQCLGIHPWDLTEAFLEKLDAFEFIFMQADVLCMGEMGLDRVKNKEHFDIQKKVFSFQLEVAAKRNDPFIVLHCVKAYNDVFECINNSNYKGKVVFHDYNGDAQTTQDLVKKGCYFSYGNMLLFPNSKGFKSLLHIPIERIFLETDEHKHFDIKDAYEKMAEQKGLSVSDLCDQVMKNFEELKS